MGLFHSPSPVMAEGKTHLSLVVCGHVDAGKSTTTGHLLFELGGISEREMEKLKEKAAQLGKSSFSFAFYLDTQKDERERGVTISCTTKEFFTDKYHYTIIDAPGHRDFIKNMISGAGQADVALLMVPADKGGFEKAVAKGNRATGEIEGQTRQHSRLINLLGVEKVIVGVNKMDNTSPTPYLQSRFDEIAGEVLVMLKTAGYKEDKIKKEFPFIPITGWEGDNLVKKTEKMPCRGKVFSIVMHHKQVERAMAGDNVGLNIKGLSKENMPRVGDIICDEKDSLTETAEFTMQVAVQDHPGQLKAATYDEKSKEYRGGFCPIAFARTARAPVQLKQIDWKMGKKSTGGAKVEGAEFIEKNDMAQVVFAPKGPIVVTSFKECAGLGRVAIMDSNALVMLGKVVKCSYKS